MNLGGLQSVTLEQALAVAAVLLLVSVVASKISDRFGIPVLLLFLALGMLAGSDGLGGIYFEDYPFAQTVGVVALVFILFAGGMDTDWKHVRPVAVKGMALATAGVFITAVLAGVFAQWLFGLSLAEGFLLGAVVSSTDAAAVLAVLRSKGVNLRQEVQALLELESGSNDPMAIFLTLSAIQLVTQPALPVTNLIFQFLLQMSLGLAAGYVSGRVLPLFINRLRLGYDGLYPVLTVAAVLLLYSLTALLGGNGFLAVYIAGITFGNQRFVHRQSLLRFHDGIAWLMQIAMFVILGLLVFPSRLIQIIGPGLLFTAFLMLVARPASVLVTLLPTRTRLKEKAFLSWVGLRGAVPIVLATYPYVHNLPVANLIFNVVFFVVLISVLLQGTSVPAVARWLQVEAKSSHRDRLLSKWPWEVPSGALRELTIPDTSDAVGKAITQLSLPDDFLIVLVERGTVALIPKGTTVLEAGDRLIVTAALEDFEKGWVVLAGQSQADKRPATYSLHAAKDGEK